MPVTAVTGVCCGLVLLCHATGPPAPNSGQASVSPDAILAAWRDWCRELERLALSGERRFQSERIISVRTAPSHSAAAHTEEKPLRVVRHERWTVIERFVGKWPEVRWEEQETKVVPVRDGEVNAATRRRAGVVRNGKAFLLSGSGGGGWIITNVLRNVYDPDDPPSLVDYLTQHVLGCHGSQRPFCTPVPRGVRMWLRQAKGGHICFDRVEAKDEGVIVEWKLDLSALPEPERLDLLPYKSGRFVLQTTPPYLPLQETYRGEVVDGGVSNIERAVSYVEVARIPLAKSVSFEMLLESSDARHYYVSKEEVEYEVLGTELSADALSLRHFGLPDDVVTGPPEPGSLRPIKLALAAIALLLAGIGLGRWLRSLKTS